MKITKEIRSNKGITMVSLVITIIVMLIIASMTMYTSLERFEINNFNKMKNDIELLSDKVNNYYFKYNGYPVVRNEKKQVISYVPRINFVNEDDLFYILDLEAMGSITVNYGKVGYELIKQNSLQSEIVEQTEENSDVYIINQKSGNIYYVKGIELDGQLYYTSTNIEKIEDIIPPSKPEIKVVSGIKNSKGDYLSAVEIEFVPGRDSQSGINRTTYSINNGIEEDISNLNNNIKKIEEDGEYIISAKSYDNEGNVSDTSTLNIRITILKVGDYIHYDCYTGVDSSLLTYTSEDSRTGYTTSDGLGQTFTVDPSTKWKILEINNNNILITTSDPILTNKGTNYYLRGKEGYVNGTEELNNICKIFGHNKYAKEARSFKAEDINRRMNIQAPIGPETSIILNPTDGIVYVNGNISKSMKYIYYDEELKIWKELQPGEEIKVRKTEYEYSLTKNTLFRIGDDGVTIIEYWLANNSININTDNWTTYYYMKCFRKRRTGEISGTSMIDNMENITEDAYGVRPVVSLISNIELFKDEFGVWQIEE